MQVIPIHLGSLKMYKNLKVVFWWSSMKRDIIEYVSKCQALQIVIAEYQRPNGLLQSLPILKEK